MGKFLWIVGAATLVAAVYVVMTQQLGPLATSDNIEDAASGIGGWGTKQRATGTGGQLKGKVEQGAGDLLGNDKLSNQGALDQAAGAIKDAAGQAAGAVSDAVRKLNQ